jgi:putative tryptophan/tyrosine transport system substrate-binding protein
MRRREFIVGLGSAAAWPVVASGQQGAMPVIGWLPVATAPGTMERFLPAFTQGLADTGYVVGRNVTIESREGGVDQMPALAADLVRRQVTVIVATGIRTVQAAKAATQTIPVVFAIVGDPVELGFVASLNRPSGNLTGITSVGIELAGKRLDLLHKLVPVADPIALLAGSAGPGNQTETTSMQSAARALGVRLLPFVVETESDVAAVFASLVEQHAGALVTTSSTFPSAVFEKIISLAGRYAVPALFFGRNQVVRGGLASYGVANGSEGIVGGGLVRQMGVYTGRILKGEKPADLPVLQPTTFELVINLKTAKALGLTIPETLLATADEVIQ